MFSQSFEDKLIAAIQVGDPARVTKLVRARERQREYGQYDFCKWAFREAGQLGNVNVIRALMDSDINGLEYGAHAAVQFGQVEALGVFLEKVGIDEHPKHSGTIFDTAAEAGQNEIIEFLLDWGVNIDGHINGPDECEDLDGFSEETWLKHGWFLTPLETAMRAGRLETVKLLLARGACTCGIPMGTYLRIAAERQANSTS